MTHLVELLSAAQPEDHGITLVVVWAGEKTLRQMPTRAWLQCVHEPLLDQSLAARLYWQEVKLSQLARLHCDYLFAPGGSYNGTFRPFVTMSRNLLPFEENERRRYGVSWMSLKMLLLKSSQKQTFRRADGVIFLSEYARSVVKKTVNLHGYQPIIPHGINGCFYQSPKKQKTICAYSKREPFRLLYVSTIDFYKHQWRVVKAVAALRTQGVPLALDLIGPAYPPALRHLRKVIGQVDSGKDFIRYAGPVSYSELVSHYHGADGFVFASSCENMPHILLEAMASGLPIACSNRGPMPEVLGNAGIYFNPERSREIAHALQCLVEDVALRERCARMAHDRAETYSWQRSARDTFSYLAGLAQTTVPISCNIPDWKPGQVTSLSEP